MRRYTPAKKPKPREWLSLSEEERIALVVKAHSDMDLEASAKRVHAVLHVVVENQLAMGMNEVVDAVGRLRKEGLDRHDCIHAVGSVLIDHIHDSGPPGEAGYLTAVKHLTAKGWLESFDDT